MMPHQINQYKIISQSKSGASFTYNIQDNDKSELYYWWSYIIIGDRMFVSDMQSYAYAGSYDKQKIKYPQIKIVEFGVSPGIFGDLPDFYAPYTRTMIEQSDAYIKLCRQWNQSGYNNGWASNTTGDLKAKADIAYKSLYATYMKCAKNYGQTHSTYVPQLGMKNYDGAATTIPYIEEEGLPYKVITPVTLEAIWLPPFMHNAYPAAMTSRKNKVTVNLPSADSLTFMKQSPLMFTAAVSFDIKVNAIPSNKLLMINAYVPGNGADNLQIGDVREDFIHFERGITYSINANELNIIPGIELPPISKGNGVYTVYLLINGWGTPELLNKMQSLVFTNKKFRKQDVVTGKGVGFPSNPNYDYMDAWYDNLRREYLNLNRQ